MTPAVVTLARWLGPWAGSTSAPEVTVSHDQVDGMRVRLYGRGTARAPYLIAPGLHYAGADDPRMDRFCRILAASGRLVIAPFVPDYLALTPTARAIDDFAQVFEARGRWCDRRPVVFSVSFGSLLALALAARHGDELERLIVFGGYAEFDRTMRFCLTGDPGSGREAARDPLNQPVVLMNLLAHLDPPCGDPAVVAAGWRRYVERTWGRPELKVRARFAPIADEIAATLPDAVRPLFHVGVGTAPGAAALALSALARFDARALDPTRYLPSIRGRVDLVHGTDDDVIPYEQSHALAAGLTRADVRLHVTGMYGHTGSQAPSLQAAARELRTMWRVLRVLAA